MVNRRVNEMFNNTIFIYFWNFIFCLYSFDIKIKASLSQLWLRGVRRLLKKQVSTSIAVGRAGACVQHVLRDALQNDHYNDHNTWKQR